MRKIFLFLLVIVLVGGAEIAEAQQLAKVRRIGYLVAGPPSAVSDRREAFREGLREHGYVEGKNIVIESRYAEGKLDRLPQLAAELVRLQVDVIVTGGSAPTQAARGATTTIPIVMEQDSDPVANEFVVSLARPGRNITGLSNLSPEISGKRMELLKEILPKLSRVAVFGTSTEPGNAQALKETEVAAGAFGIQTQYLDVLTHEDIPTVFRHAAKGRADAAVMLASPVFNSHRTQITGLAVKSRLASI